MEIPRIETLLLQEMEEVKGGRDGTCRCETGAHQGTDDSGICWCSTGAAQKGPTSSSVCLCSDGASQ
jgi:hypothetical protein